MQKHIKLSRAEALLIDMAHSESQIGHQAADRLMQSRLSAITDQYDVKDGTEISFQRTDDGEIILIFEDTAPGLKVVNGADAEVYREDEEDGS